MVCSGCSGYLLHCDCLFEAQSPGGGGDGGFGGFTTSQSGLCLGATSRCPDVRATHGTRALRSFRPFEVFARLRGNELSANARQVEAIAFLFYHVAIVQILVHSDIGTDSAPDTCTPSFMRACMRTYATHTHSLYIVCVCVYIYLMAAANAADPKTGRKTEAERLAVSLCTGRS